MSFNSSHHYIDPGQRKQIFLAAARTFTDRGIPVSVTKAKSHTSIDDELITNTARLDQVLSNNRYGNVAAVISTEHNLAVIKLEREGSWSQDPKVLLAEFEEVYGKLPSTVTIQYSDRLEYRLFQIPPGIKVRNNRLCNEITIVNSDLILLEQSEYNGETVTELSGSSRIAELPAKWLEHISTAPVYDAPLEYPQTASVEQPADDAVKHLPVLAEIPEYEFWEEAKTDTGCSDPYEGLKDEKVLAKIAEQLTLFRDELSVPHYFCEGVPFPATSKYVPNWLRHQFLLSKKRMPSDKMVRELFDMLESMARFESQQIRLHTRIARRNNKIVYDLGNKKHVVITASSWEIVDSEPGFRTYKHQQPQTVPVTGGNAWKVLQYISVPEEKKLLIMVYLICLFIPEIAHPLLAVCGDQGSAKSFTCNVFNRLVDPTLTEKIIIPKNERDLIQTLRQKYVTVLDNISVIAQRISDILCQVCTGGGISFRQLYTDEGENIAQLRHIVILNSISMPIINADLLDRTIILMLQRIAPENRKTEDELWSAFEADRAEILGGIFDILVKAMAIYPTVTLVKSPRLADFAKWGYTVAVAMGMSGEQFLEDYDLNVSNQSEGVVNNNVLCQALISLMIGKEKYEKYVSDVFLELQKIAGADAKDATFPKLPHNLRGHLERLQATLQQYGITYQFSERDKTGVKITFLNSKASPAGESSAETGTPDTPGTPTPDSNPLNDNVNVADVPDVANLQTFDFGGEELYV